MNIFTIIGIALIAASISLLLKKFNPEISLVIRILAGVLILGLIILNLRPVLNQISSLINSANIPGEYLDIVFKAIGITFITQLAYDSCRDAEESSLASKIEMAGKIAILIISLPLFEKIAEIAISLIKG